MQRQEDSMVEDTTSKYYWNNECAYL